MQPTTRRDDATAEALLDDHDLDIVAALHIAPRVSTTALASILDTSSSTVYRRIARMQSDRILRVVGRYAWHLIVSSNPYELWISSFPGKSNEVVRELQQIADVQAIVQTSGSNDIYANLYPLRGSSDSELLVERIPSIPGIRALDSRMILETAKVGQQWRYPRLSEHQVAALEEQAAVEGQAPLTDLSDLTDLEFQTMRLMGQDGRISAAEAARRLGVSTSTAARAIRMLLQTGAVTSRVEVEQSLIGYPMWTFIALDLEPSQIKPATEALTDHPAIRLLCTVTGDSPVTMSASFTGPDAFAAFLRDDLGGLPGMKSVTSSTALRTVRRYWVEREGQLLGPAVQDVLRR